KNEPGNRINHAEFRRHIDKALRRLDFAVVIAPADQRFKADHFTRANVDLRLKRTTELHIADGKPQSLLELHARLPALVHRRIEKDRGAHGGALGAVKRALRVSPQLLKARPMLREKAHPDGCGGEYLESIDMEGLAQLLGQACHGWMQLHVGIAM